jgi:predicted deacetylase
MTSARQIVIAIHDVAPSLAAEVHYLLDACDAMGARPLVLKVIPNEDGRNDIRDDSEFARLLAREAAVGSEIVLHGYTHRVAHPIRGFGLRQVRGRLFASTAAEFLTLDDRQTRERLLAGRRILRDVGLDPRGFCAPGWLASPYLPRQLQDCGFHYYVSMMAVHDVIAGRQVWTPWMGYMGGGPAQERLVRLGGQAWATVTRTAPVLKVFLHPQGARRSADCARILRLIPRLIENRRIVSYESLITRQP